MKQRRKYTSVKNPVLMAIENASLISARRNAEYTSSEIQALKNMATGQFGDHEWVVMVDVANMAEVMAKSGVGHEVIPIAAEAQVVLAHIRKRKKEEGTFTCRPDEIFVLRELQEYHDLQRQSVAYGQYLGFAKRVANYVRGGNGNTYQDILEQVNEAEASL